MMKEEFKRVLNDLFISCNTTDLNKRISNASLFIEDSDDLIPKKADNQPFLISELAFKEYYLITDI